MPPKATVLIPVYNTREAWLRPCLNSVLNEKGDFQLLIVDDGSDNVETLAVLEEFSHKEKVRIIRHIKNRGIGHALTTGILESRNELILRLDSDDMMSKGRIERQVSYMRQNPDVAVCAGQAQLMDENGNLLLWSTNLRYQTVPMWRQGNPICHSTVIFRRSVLQAVGSYEYDDTEAEDYELWCRIEWAGFKIAVLDEIFCYYRDHLTQANIEKRRAEHCRIVRKYFMLEQQVRRTR